MGWSVALSSDGNTAVAGAPFDSQGGAVYVYTRSHGAWSQQGPKLVGNGAAGAADLGTSVALSADGNTAIVGGSTDNGGSDQGVGAVWVFTRANGVWNQQGAKLVGAGAVAGSHLGYSVAVSADGNTAIAGGPGDRIGFSPDLTTGPPPIAGGAWVFTRDSSGAWHPQGNPLLGNDASGFAGQGRSVALSSDGNTALVGGDWDSNTLGASWVFTRTGSVWSQQGHKLVGTGGSGVANQGYSVALSSDGNTAIVGGPSDSANGNFEGGPGAVWIFTRTSGVWTQQGQRLVGTGADESTGLGNTAAQGYSVALSGDGNTAMAGGPDENGGFATGIGAAWVFRRGPNGLWSQQGSKLVGSGSAPDNLTDGFDEGPREGSSVALSADGTTALIGGWDDSGLDGAAWPFALPHFTFTTPTAANGGTPFNFMVSVFDANYLLLPTYSGTVHFTSTDAAAALPADSTLSSGVRSLSATLNTGGSQTITATDTANPAVTGTSGAIAVTGTVPLVPPSPVSATIAAPSFTFVYTDPRGYHDLNVVDILVNNFLDGRHACYLAYIVAQNTLILVDDGGDAGGPYAGNVALGNSAPIHNSQCSVNLVSASGSANNLTLVVSIAFTGSFAGDKILYLSAGDVAGNNSGWQPLGVVRAPGGTQTTTTAVVSMSPNRGTGLGPNPFTFNWSDTLGYQDLGVENILINSALDGRHACYLAFSRPGNVLYLEDDNGDGLLPGQSLAASGSVSNSQCTVSWASNPVSPGGNNLSLTLNIAFTAAFAGNRIVYMAARDVNEANNTDWHAMGTWTPR